MISDQICPSSHISERIASLKVPHVPEELNNDDLRNMILGFHQAVLKRFIAIYNHMVLVGVIAKA